MSVAVAVQKGRSIAIAADTQESFGDRRVLRGDHRSSKIMRIGAANNDAWVTAWRRAWSTNCDAENAAIIATLAPAAMAAAKE